MTGRNGRRHVYMLESIEEASSRSRKANKAIFEVRLRDVAFAGATVLRSGATVFMVAEPGIPAMFVSLRETPGRSGGNL